jgi:hypothetical protein
VADDRLASATEALAHQRRWFAELQEHVRGGGKFALINADTPHELLRAFDLPYVVNQWWSSVVSSRGSGAAALEALAAHDYPRESEQYNALGLGAALESTPTDIPGWGALPRPDLVLADLTGDTTRKVFDAWHESLDVPFFAFESPSSPHTVDRWWERIADDWEEVVGRARIDLLTAEMGELTGILEELTGRRLDLERLEQILGLANEQSEWNRKTRDLIATARPLPVRVTDTIPAVMLPQWHRGSEWGRDAARHLHDEVAERVRDGVAVVPDERARLMWIGRGLWFDLGFYRHFEAEFGAVFVWSMYLAIGADAYVRRGGPALRALASRFVAFGERLYAAPWSVDWYVEQARSHGVDGVVHLVSDDPRGSWATTRALRAAGIPVYELHADNADDSTYDVDAVRAGVATWLEESVLRDPS